MRLGKGPVGVSEGRKVRGKRVFAGSTERKGRTANRTFKDLFSTNNVGGDGGGTCRLGKGHQGSIHGCLVAL
jgi:hypothetical protein